MIEFERLVLQQLAAPFDRTFDLPIADKEPPDTVIDHPERGLRDGPAVVLPFGCGIQTGHFDRCAAKHEAALHADFARGQAIRAIRKDCRRRQHHQRTAPQPCRIRHAFAPSPFRLLCRLLSTDRPLDSADCTGCKRQKNPAPAHGGTQASLF